MIRQLVSELTMPLLEEVLLAAPSGQPDTRALLHPDSSLLNAPNLRHISITDRPRSWDSIRAPQLRRLCVNLMLSRDMIPHMSFLQCIQASPLLEELCIGYCAPITLPSLDFIVDKVPTIALPRLHHLCLRGSAQAILAILRPLAFEPRNAVTRLVIETCADPTPPFP